jgi:hypothetical protein
MDWEMENTHMHSIMMIPAGSAEDLTTADWDELWRQCAGDSARSTDPRARFAESVEAVLNYLTKMDLLQEAMIGISDPLRYVQRVMHGHSMFSTGGMLRTQTAGFC